MLKDASAVFPPLQAAASALIRVIDQIEEIADTRHELERMAQRITSLATLLRQYAGRTNDEDIQNRLNGMTGAILQQTRRIEEQLAPRVQNLITNSLDILEHMRAVSYLITIFEMDTALNTEAKASDIKNVVSQLHDSYVLEKLCPVAGSSYDDIGGSVECMPGTRVGVLTELAAWATDPDSPAIYFLTGMAGAGKSAIAYSFAKLFENQTLLGASFFCSRASEARSNVAGIIPSIVFRLAYHSQRFAEAIIHAIKNAPGVSFPHRSPAFQFTTLITEPLHTLAQDFPIPVIVIDALDECSGLNVVRELLSMLIRSSLNPIQGGRLKFFITSRPVPHIERAFSPEVVARRLRLLDIEDVIVHRRCGEISEEESA
ncbi:hypothetical protein B0H14DRAFT_1171958 [Mycena olivaceomarginata]|nr:hypothetical protein B0H14DRAFT_1171958 [Mycena olivaceomarginata]